MAFSQDNIWNKSKPSFADGMYMMEVDRVLRPGGYWVLSGPPINWRNNYVKWQRPKEEPEEEQRKIEDTAKLLGWEKKYEKAETAIWRKRIIGELHRDNDLQLTVCESKDVDDVWYKKLEACVTPTPETISHDEDGDTPWKPYPERLNALPSGISTGAVPGVSADTFQDDNKAWKKHVSAYRRTNKLLETGIYHDWCEAFSMYPRTYDLIHANNIFSLYKDKCEAEDILLEMDRILRPESAVIIRDHMDVLAKLSRIVKGMRWK